MDKTKFGSGVIVALPTPFLSGLELDLPSFEKLLHHVVDNGVNGILVCGSTGESFNLSAEDQDQLIRSAIRIAGDKGLDVLVGTGSSHALNTLQQTEKARDLGATGALVVCPPYVRPSQDALVDHFSFLSSQVQKLPLMIYNNPGRAAIDFSAKSLEALRSCESIIAIKESSGEINRISDIISLSGTRFQLFSGDDPLTFCTLSLGGDGVVSVLGNVLPSAVSRLVQAMKEGDFGFGRQIHEALYPLSRALFIESSPAPVKYILSKIAIGDGSVRRPLFPLSKDGKRILDRTWDDALAALKKLGCL